MESPLPWYTLKVTSGQEVFVRNWLMKERETYGVADLFLNAVSPCEKKIVIQNGKKVTKSLLVYSGYVFINADINNEKVIDFLKMAPKSWGLVGQRGCGFTVKPVALKDEEVSEILNLADNLQLGLSTTEENVKFQGRYLFKDNTARLLQSGSAADFIVTGQWAKKAYQEAQKYGKATKIATSEDETFSYIPDCSDLPISEDADYVYICENNTIYGTKFWTLPNTKGKDLVADMSSCIISEPVDVTKFGMIYAGAQKNMAPAGLTVVIIREDLLGNARPETPSMLDYQLMAENDSMYNTPPCYAIYVAGLVYEWIESIGGLEKMKEMNEKKAKVLYDYLDSQDYYVAPVEKESRSMMNVTFVTESDELNALFVKEATAAGFVNLKGHRSVGGMRASIYNAMPIEGVEKLVEFMKKFEAENK